MQVAEKTAMAFWTRLALSLLLSILLALAFPFSHPGSHRASIILSRL